MVPLKDGGSNAMSNLVTLCKDCHQSIHSDKTDQSKIQKERNEPNGLTSLFMLIMGGASYAVIKRPVVLMIGVCVITAFFIVNEHELAGVLFFLSAGGFIGLVVHGKKQAQASDQPSPYD